MPENEPQFREGEAGSMSDVDRLRLVALRQLNDVLRAVHPGEEGPVLNLAETFEIMLQALASAQGRAEALDAEAGDLRTKTETLGSRLKTTSERLAAVEVDATLDKTGVLNKKTFEERGQALFKECRRDGKPLACIFVDLDYFKQVNDTHGHPAGDRVLEDLAKLLQHCSREGDVVGRYGGEEFAILLPGVDGAMVGKIMERWRLMIEQYYFRNGSDITRLQVTASLGGAVTEEGDEDCAGLVARADKAMYQAKNWGDDEGRSRGRNMAVLAAIRKDAAGERTHSFLRLSPEDRLRPRHAPRDGDVNMRAGEAASVGLKGPAARR